MNLINRTALIVIPKQPYIDWANSLDDGVKLNINNPRYEYSLYLIDNVVREADVERVLKQYYVEIFEQELEAWHLKKEDWPKQRGFQTFKRWFELKICSMVLDLCRERIELEAVE